EGWPREFSKVLHNNTLAEALSIRGASPGGGSRRAGGRFGDSRNRTAMKARIRWVEGVSFVAETGSGHSVMVDGAPDQGGRNIGIRPMELVLAGAAACTAFDVVLILRKARQPIADCVVDAEAERA